MTTNNVTPIDLQSTVFHIRGIVALAADRAFDIEEHSEGSSQEMAMHVREALQAVVELLEGLAEQLEGSTPTQRANEEEIEEARP
jgi:hypothetical protein